MYDVYLYDEHVGSLLPRGDGVQFIYGARALANDALPGISLAMPKREARYGGKVARAFFQNLLPEGAYGRLVAQAAGTPPNDDSALLGAIGGECPGAIAIWPAGQTPPSTPRYESLARDDLARLFDPASPLAIAAATRRARLSLPGVQEKTALFRDQDGHWFRPVDGAATSHILKQAPTAFPELLENEIFCMTLAARSGIPVAPVGLPLPDVRVICAQRFDRVPGDAAQPLSKLHQEDFCQLLSVLPARKYEQDGGPGVKACAGVIGRASALAIEDIPRLLRWVAFNYAIGNEDAHGKNLAILYEAGGLRLAPHYDLVSTEMYDQLARRCAMKIGGADEFRRVQASDWRRVAAVIQLPWAAARAELRLLADQIDAALPAATAVCESQLGRSTVYGRIGALVRARTALLGRAVAGR